MLHHLLRFFRPSSEIEHAYALYAHINETSRQPMFFQLWGVPDTLDGRFELILLHMFLYLHTLKAQADSRELQQRVIEAFFEDMDRSIREIGVTDTGVGKRVKAMANAFYGRIHAYETALQDDVALEAALRKNLYGTVEPPEEIGMVVRYVHEQLAVLATQPVASVEFLAIAEQKAG